MMSRNPLFSRQHTHSFAPQAAEQFHHTGYLVFDQPNRQQFQMTRSTTEQSRQIANAIRGHIRRFYHEKLHRSTYDFIDVKMLANLPQYSMRAIAMIDQKLKSIQEESQAKVFRYYELIGNVLTALEDYVFPFVTAFLPPGIKSTIDRVLMYISRAVKHVVRDRIGCQLTFITTYCIRHIAKEKLVPLMHDPVGEMTVSWDEEDDIFGEDNTLFEALTGMTKDMSGNIALAMAIFGESSPAVAKEPVKEKTLEPQSADAAAAPAPEVMTF